MKFKSLNAIKPSVVVVLGLLVLTGCTSIKVGGVKSGKNLFETFYVGEDGTQYFIKPLFFSNTENKDVMDMDFTFRYKNEVKDSVIVNFAIRSEKIIKQIDRLTLSNATQSIESNDVELLFNEKRKNEFYSRFSTKITMVEFNQMFENFDWKTVVVTDGASQTFEAEKKTKKSLSKLADKVFIIFQ